MKRKPGEPIYLMRHMLGLAMALLASVLFPLLYHRYVEPLSFSTRFVAGLLIALNQTEGRGRFDGTGSRQPKPRVGCKQTAQSVPRGCQSIRR